MAESKMVTGLFRDRRDAEHAFRELVDRGFLVSDINVMMSDAARTQYYPNSHSDTKSNNGGSVGSLAEEGMGVGGAIGTAVGATLAAVAAVGTSLALPGLGLIVSGPLAAAFAGGGAGAVTGGLIGGLIGLGIPEKDATVYEDVLKNNGILLGVKVQNNDDISRAKDVMNSCNGEQVCAC